MTRKYDNLLLIFIKNPIPGKVKTRLGKTIGHDAAVDVYKKLLSKTRNAALQATCDCHVYYGDYINEQDHWNPKDFGKFLQNQGNLGDRMKHAFKRSFEAGYKRVEIIGSDCPEMSTELINSGFEKLQKHQVVLGPAIDGGYYLLGMANFINLFDDIAWSTASVFKDTIEKIEKLNMNYATLPVKSDLDTEEDLKKYPELL